MNRLRRPRCPDGQDNPGFRIAIGERHEIIRRTVYVAAVYQNNGLVFGGEFEDGIAMFGDGVLMRLGVDLYADAFGPLQDIYRLIIGFGLQRVDDDVLQQPLVFVDHLGSLLVGLQHIEKPDGRQSGQWRHEGELRARVTSASENLLWLGAEELEL